MKIAFFDTKPYDIPSFERYGKEYGIEYHFLETKLSKDTAPLAAGFDGVCVFVHDVVDRRVIDLLCAENVRFLALRCAGYNHVDVRYAFGKIHIFHVPSYSPSAVAEHTCALLLTCIRRTHKAYMRTREFNFSLRGLVGMELCGKRIGIIGTGKIGMKFAAICQGFGMEVLGYDRDLKKDAGFRYADLSELFKTCDILSLHCPLTEETRHLIDQGAIAQMKEGVVILNTSRGALIDSDALLAGIKSGKVGGACLDVYEEETDLFFEDRSDRILQDDTLARLISMPNVIVSSHQAYLTNEALDAIAKTTTENLAFFEENGVCENELCLRTENGDPRQKGLQKCF